MKRDIGFVLVVVLLLYFLANQIDFFSFIPKFPFVDIRFKHKEIFEDRSKVDEAVRKIEELKTQEEYYRTKYLYLVTVNDSLHKKIGEIDSATAAQIADLENEFKNDSASVKKFYRQGLYEFYPPPEWMNVIGVNYPLSFQEIGRGAILFQKLHGCKELNQAKDSIISNNNQIMENLSGIIRTRGDIIDQKDTVISAQMRQIQRLFYPYSMSVSAGVRTMLLDSGVYAGLFGRYTIKAINLERFEVYFSGEGNYFPEKGFGAAAETGIKIKFGN